MKIYKRYKDEHDVFPVATFTARAQLARAYTDVESVMKKLQKGNVVQTPFALYAKEARLLQDKQKR